MTRPRPLPEPDSLTEAFWSAGREGVLRLQRCRACGHLRYPPSPVCPRCLDERAEWAATSGRGEILSYAVFHRAYRKDWEPRVPYAVLLVQLDDGPRMLSDFEGDPTGLTVGRRVQAAFRPTEGGWSLPVFEVVE